MYVYHNESGAVFNSFDELSTSLDRSIGINNANVFYLSREKGAYPMLQVFAMAELAVLYFFPSESSPGFLSEGMLAAFADQDFFDFPALPHSDAVQLPAESVTTMKVAREAIREFMTTNQLPVCISWTEL